MKQKNEKLLEPVVEACVRGDGEQAIERLLEAACRMVELGGKGCTSGGATAFEEALETCKGQMMGKALGMGQDEFVAITGLLGLVPPEPMMSQPEWRTQVGDLMRAARTGTETPARVG